MIFKLQEDTINPSFEYIDELQPNALPTLNHINQARILFKSSSEFYKKFKIISWITTSLAVHEIEDSKVHSLLWQTLKEFLTSQKFQSSLKDDDRELKLHHGFANCLVHEISKTLTSNKERLLELMEITSCFTFSKIIYCDFNSSFSIMMQVVTAWSEHYVRYIENKDWTNDDSYSLVDFFPSLLKNLYEKAQNIRKYKVPQYFINYLMIPALQVYHCSKKLSQLQTTNLITVKTCEDFLFCRGSFCEKKFSVQSDYMQEKYRNESKKITNYTDQYFFKLQEFLLSNKENVNFLHIAFEIFLKSCPEDKFHEKKVYFLLNCVEILKEVQCSSLVAIYIKFLQLCISHSMSKWSMENEVRLELENFFCYFVDLLMEEKAIHLIQKGLVVLAESGYCAVGSKLDDVMKSLFQALLQCKNMDYTWIQSFFNAAIKSFINVRKLFTFVSTFIKTFVEKVVQLDETYLHQRCLVCSGIISRAFISQYTSSTQLLASTIDIWEDIQSKARELIPYSELKKIEKDQTNLRVVVGEKRKLLESNECSKKPKLATSLSVITQCLLNLLHTILVKVEFLELRSAVQRRVEDLLKQLYELVSDLKSHVIETDHNLSAQYFQLLAFLGHREFLLNDFAAFNRDSLNKLVISDASKWEVNVGSSFLSRYYWKRWLCFKVLLHASYMQQNNYEDIKRSLDESIFKLLSFSLKSSTVEIVAWDYNPETIANEDHLNIATLLLVKNYLAPILACCSDDSIPLLTNALVHYYLMDVKNVTTNERADTVICDILKCPAVSENKRFLSACIKSLVRNTNKKIKKKSSKSIKSFLKLVKLNLDGCLTDDVSIEDKIEAVFQKQSNDDMVQAALRKVVQVLLFLPHTAYTSNHLSSVLIIIICHLSTNHDDYKLQENCFHLLANVIRKNERKTVTKFFPPSVILPHLAAQWHKYNFSGQVALQRLLSALYGFSVANVEILLNTMIPLLTDGNIEAVIISSWLLQVFCYVVKKYSPIQAGSHYTLLFNDEEFTTTTNSGQDFLNISRKSIDSHSNDFEGCIKSARRVIKVSSQILIKCDEIFISSCYMDLLKLCFIASFYIDYFSVGKTNNQVKLIKKLKDINDWINDIIATLSQETDDALIRSKIQLLLCISEQNFICQRNDRANLNEKKSLLPNLSSLNSINFIMSIYENPLVVQSSLAKTLVERLLLTQLAQCEIGEWKNILSAVREKIRLSDNSNEPQSIMDYVCMVCRHQHIFNMTAIIDTSHSTFISKLLSKFFQDVFHDIVLLIERLSCISSQKAKTSSLIAALQTLVDLILMKEVLPGRLVSIAFPSFVRVNLTEVLSSNDKEFEMLFRIHSNFLSSLLSKYSHHLKNVFPLFLEVCRKLLKAVLNIARKSIVRNSSRSTGNLVNIGKECSFRLEKIFQSIASLNQALLGKSASFLIADYISMQSSDSFHTVIKKNLDKAVYYIFALCGEEDRKFLNRNLSKEARSLFHAFYKDYSDNFKYTGWV